MTLEPSSEPPRAPRSAPGRCGRPRRRARAGRALLRAAGRDRRVSPAARRRAGRADSAGAGAAGRAGADRRGTAVPVRRSAAAARSWPGCSKAPCAPPAPDGRRCCCSRASRGSARAGCWRRCSPCSGWRATRWRRHAPSKATGSSREAGCWRSRAGVCSTSPASPRRRPARWPRWRRCCRPGPSAFPARLRPSRCRSPARWPRSVRAAAAEQPVVLALDDAQWVDPDSALGLGTVLRDLAALPVTVVLATAPYPPRPELDELRSRIGRDIEGSAVRLRRLDRAALRHLAEQMLPGLRPRRARPRRAPGSQRLGRSAAARRGAAPRRGPRPRSGDHLGRLARAAPYPGSEPARRAPRRGHHGHPHRRATPHPHRAAGARRRRGAGRPGDAAGAGARARDYPPTRWAARSTSSSGIAGSRRSRAAIRSSRGSFGRWWSGTW